MAIPLIIASSSNAFILTNTYSWSKRSDCIVTKYHTPSVTVVLICNFERICKYPRLPREDCLIDAILLHYLYRHLHFDDTHDHSGLTCIREDRFRVREEKGGVDREDKRQTWIISSKIRRWFEACSQTTLPLYPRFHRSHIVFYPSIFSWNWRIRLSGFHLYNISWSIAVEFGLSWAPYFQFSRRLLLLSVLSVSLGHHWSIWIHP